MRLRVQFKIQKILKMFRKVKSWNKYFFLGKEPEGSETIVSGECGRLYNHVQRTRPQCNGNSYISIYSPLL